MVKIPRVAEGSTSKAVGLQVLGPRPEIVIDYLCGTLEAKHSSKLDNGPKTPYKGR